MEDLFSHPILKSCCHHVRGEELSFLKVTRNTQTRLHRVSVIKKLLQTYSFAHFHYSLLQINVPFKIGMCSPAPENRISERKLQIILSRASWQEITSNFMTDLCGHAPCHRVQKYKERIIKSWDGFLTQHYENIYNVLTTCFYPREHCSQTHLVSHKGFTLVSFL